MKVITIKLNKREFKCTLGLGFLGEIIDELDIEYSELLTKYGRNPFKYVPLLMFHCVKWELEEDGKEVDFNLKQFRAWIDDEGGVTNNELKKFSQAFMESILKDVPNEETDGEPKKK